MQPKWAGRSLVICLAFGFSACSAIQAQRQAEEKRHQEFVQRVDFAHIWVTSGDPPSDKPYQVLGDVKYTEPFSPNAIDEQQIRNKLKKMAYQRWPNSLDALVDEKSEVSKDDGKVTVSAEAIHYRSSVDRAALHRMNEGIVVSPNEDE